MEGNNLIKKGVVVAVILLFVSVSVIPSTGTTSIKQIAIPASSGNTLYVGGSGPNNYTKIQNAIDNASDGDTVFVYNDSSPYYENVVVDKSINLIGEDRDTTVIDGSGSGDIVYISADWVNISGFTIQNGDIGIDISSKYTTISGNNISHNIGCMGSGVGILVGSGNYNTITGNTISNNDNGIDLWHSSSNTITGNTIISNNGWCGIYLDYFSNNNTIAGNNISNNGEGIYLGSSSNNIITGNSISGNNFSGICLHDSRSNTISDNNISDNFLGIHHFESSSNNIITGNSISNNGGGIHFKSSSSNNITGNKFTSNHLSILFWGSSSNIVTSNDILNSGGEGILLFLSNKNIIEKNNFIGNRIHAIFYISWRNNWDSNYWNNWIGIGPKIIFGLLGLTGKIPWINFDWHPAREPYDIPMEV